MADFHLIMKHSMVNICYKYISCCNTVLFQIFSYVDSLLVYFP